MRILTGCAEKSSRIRPLCTPWCTALLNSLASKSWLQNFRQLAKRVPASGVYPAYHSSIKKLTASQQELVKQFPKAASSKPCCSESLVSFGEALPGEGSQSWDVQFLLLTLLEGLKKSISIFPFLLLHTSLYVPFTSLHPSLAAEDYCWTGISLFSRFTGPWLPAGNPQGHPSLLFTDRKDRGVWPSWPLLKIMLSQLQLFLSTSAGGRK